MRHSVGRPLAPNTETARPLPNGCRNRTRSPAMKKEREGPALVSEGCAGPRDVLMGDQDGVIGTALNRGEANAAPDRSAGAAMSGPVRPESAPALVAHEPNPEACAMRTNTTQTRGHVGRQEAQRT